MVTVQELQQDGFKRPQGGTDMGDHPPITPVAAATEAELGGGDEWRIYDYISRHFLGSLCPDCVYQKSKATVQAGGEMFTATGSALLCLPGCSSTYVCLHQHVRIFIQL
jgi:DNA topoisomerase III